MKGDMFVLAHEVKNPLCVVKGYLEMMNKDNFLEYKEIINKEIDNSLDILNSYLEYDKLTLEKEEMDLNVLLEDIKESMQEYLEDKKIELNIKILDDDIYMMGDYQKLKQVFYNLIKNSVEAHSKKISISYQLLYNELTVTLINDGDRIIPSKLAMLGNNYSDKVLGNGIGLTLSKKIIEGHNGKIKFMNNKDKGISTIISFNLA